VSLQGAGNVAAFSASAEDYAATMAPALAPRAAEVVRRAALRGGETVLDVGTGTGTAARLARGEGRRIIGLDAAPGMLEIARREAPDVEFLDADFSQIPLPDRSVDVVTSVHALLFADDRIAALREWRRVARQAGRLSLSVPGPADVVPSAVLGSVYDRYGVAWSADDYPVPTAVAQWVRDAGWTETALDTDPTTGIPLADEAAFRTWLRVGARGRATADWTNERREQFTADLMAASPRDDAGAFRLPFGTIYLTAVNR
jgi:SAM-dependent methyltransferase